MSQEIIELFDVEGTSRLSGTDKYDCQWIQFEVDYYAEQVEGICEICEGDIPFTGWKCLDGGAEVCEYHVRIVNYAK
jgi:hypothetical protein